MEDKVLLDSLDTSEIVSTHTNDFFNRWLSSLSQDEFIKELKAIFLARDVYYSSDLVGSPVFEYLDKVYILFQDFLLKKTIEEFSD